MESKTLIIPKGTKEIKEEEYYHQDEYTEVVFPSSLRVIGKWAFAGCTGLKVIELPRGIKEIGNYAFSSVKAVFFIPDTIEKIGEDAFDGDAIIFIECGEYDFSGSLKRTPPAEHPFGFYGYGDSHINYDSDNRTPYVEHHHYHVKREDFLKYLEENHLR